MTAVDQLASLSWCPGGPERFRTPYADPGGAASGIVGWALEYVWPLNEWLDQLTGDKAAVASFSAQWDVASAQLSTTNVSCTQALAALDGMQGASVRAMRRSIEQVASTAQDASEWTEAVAAAVEVASQVVTALHDSVAGALSQLAGVAVSFGDLLLSPPWEYWEKIRAFTTHVDGLVGEIEGLLDAMIDVFSDLDRLLNALVPLIDEAMDALRRFASRLAGSRLLGTLLGASFGALLGPGGLIGGIVGGLLGFEASGIVSDLLADTPAVTELGPDGLTAEQRAAYDRARDCTELGSLEDFVTQNGHTDDMGKTDRSVVDVKLVEDADGNQHYVVSLPSTQDWNALEPVLGQGWAGFLDDYPATNDLDTNIALMLSDHPELATQYQRAVYETMRQAGVPPGAPVVYSGFSQGGIMAAAMASDTDSPYTTTAIVTTGAPVDRFDIPDSVRVVSFAHRSDPVPQLDDYMDAAGRVIPGGSSLRQGNEDTTIGLDDPTPTAPGGDAPSVHSVDGYTQSVREWEAQNPEEAAEVIDLVGGEVVDHQIYTFGE
jgi:hypothetical protein